MISSIGSDGLTKSGMELILSGECEDLSCHREQTIFNSVSGSQAIGSYGRLSLNVYEQMKLQYPENLVQHGTGAPGAILQLSPFAIMLSWSDFRL